MGEHKRGRTQRRHFRQGGGGREDVWKKPRPSQPWEPFVSHNLAFDEYYKEQGIIPEKEWDEFLSMLQKPLPATFRINSSGQFADDILFQLENDFLASVNPEDIGGNVAEFVKPLPWYPDKLAWHLNFSRMQLRKNQTLERIHEFLKQENEIGNITRQEAVSMVPALFLDLQSNHYVLDTPGSKTFQLLEMIHRPVKPGSLPEGMVVANDVDVQRCNLLIHQTKRMCSANLMVTNHEAQNFPGCRLNNNSLSTNSVLERGSDVGSSKFNGDIKTVERRDLTFDRILCDVPCSGDGTIRKAPDIWRKWNTGLGNGVHRLQVQIAMRGVALLKVGGKLIYSTCSLNPVEDEAVVAEVLRQSGGSMELLDMSMELPELKRHPGLKTWKVRDKGHWLTSYRHVIRSRKTTIVPSMFPSGKTWDECNIPYARHENCQRDDINMETASENAVNEKDGNQISHKNNLSPKVVSTDGYVGPSNDEFLPSEENSREDDDTEVEAEVTSLPLERCMRILPHDQDTGGFFIAVFQKVSPFSVKDMKSKEPYRKQNYRSTQDFEEVVPGRTDVDVSVNESVSSDFDNTACSPKMKNDTVSQRDVEVTEMDTLGGGGTSCLHLDASLKEIISSDFGNAACSLNMKNDTFSEQDVKVTELDTLGSTACLHSDVVNAIESIPDDLGDGECRREICQIIGDSQKKENVETEDGKFTHVGKQTKKGKIQQQGRWRGVDPVLLLTDEKAINSIVTFYGIDESFPLVGHLVTRNSDTVHVKRIYYVSTSVRDAIKLNISAGQQLKITSVGLKMFERQSAKEEDSLCAYRISSEGLPMLLPYLRKRILYASLVDFKLLLSTRTLYFKTFQDPKFLTDTSNLSLGCCIVILRTVEADPSNFHLASNLGSSEKPNIAVGCWKGRTNLSLMVSKLESEELLERIFFNYGKEMPEMPDDSISKDNCIEEAGETPNVSDNDE
ncbi:multisite-specific tRNA:(cytosine-C(5))-methyltransferase trm4b isoform X2 [Cryptomeria japonica]|uniref:multisite-specific tRNA:(cytosine-C(5))-methyltransferase trm4b isoform X2 n=1 Tax=Cryptomeria japonica TaxID=3369 RepID=UPI0027DAA670|nr:multisite-specific tRNA:(cytosine-C(5))-methyltransferase trm4b isoform X2 [Cryptomeria japonica]